MITGIVNSYQEPIIRVTVANDQDARHETDALVDTGYTGYLTLPKSIINSLGLRWLGRDEGFLADGSSCLFDVFEARVLWDGRMRPIEIEAAGAQPLVGMALMRRHELRVEIVEGGSVCIQALT